MSTDHNPLDLDLENLEPAGDPIWKLRAIALLGIAKAAENIAEPQFHLRNGQAYLVPIKDVERLRKAIDTYRRLSMTQSGTACHSVPHQSKDQS